MIGVSPSALSLPRRGSATVDDKTIRTALAHPLERTDFGKLGKKYEGKVRDNYSAPDGQRYIVVTDRISAFDRVLGTLPLKGQLLNSLAAWWFEHDARHRAEPRAVACRIPTSWSRIECTPLPVEMVVRAYLTGTTSTSIWVHYEGAQRTFCGHALARRPEEAPGACRRRSSRRAPRPRRATTTCRRRARRSCEISGMRAADFDAAADDRDGPVRRGSAHLRRARPDPGRHQVRVRQDAGRRASCVIDEIHTPDSSRFWFAESYGERFGKGAGSRDLRQGVRAALARGTRLHGRRTDPDASPTTCASKPRGATSRPSRRSPGEPFVPNLEEPIARMRRNLGLAP